MEKQATNTITVEASVKAPVEKVWEFWNKPEHIIKWNSPSDDWHSPRSENDLRNGGKFSTRMEAKDGSFGFDFEGVYNEVVPNKVIAYTLGDGRKVETEFGTVGSETWIVTKFDAETENSLEMQRGGWQAILDNFKKYTEAN
ncbi:MAG TPA: SRPBCC family protein [Bacteroidia bacterium]|nr:SRPBCC family protein [Bacteroidia bacterium]